MTSSWTAWDLFRLWKIVRVVTFQWRYCLQPVPRPNYLFQIVIPLKSHIDTAIKDSSLIGRPGTLSFTASSVGQNMQG